MNEPFQSIKRLLFCLQVPRSRKRKKVISKEQVVDMDIDDSDSSGKSAGDTNNLPETSGAKKNKKKSDKSDSKTKVDEDHHHHHHHTKKERKKKEDKKKKNSQKGGPMHFTASAEPVDISQDGEFDGELPVQVFTEVR